MNVHLAPARPPVRHRKLPLDRRLIAEDASLSLAFRPLEAHGGPNDPEVLESVSVGAGPERHRESPRVANAPRSRTNAIAAILTHPNPLDGRQRPPRIRKEQRNNEESCNGLPHGRPPPVWDSHAPDRRTPESRAAQGLSGGWSRRPHMGQPVLGERSTMYPECRVGADACPSYLRTVLRVVTTTLQRLQDWYGNHREVRRPRSSRVRMA